MEVHHYCRQVKQDFAQCVLFDANSTEANMSGMEYIISEQLFALLPVQLRAPGIVKKEKIPDEGKMNSNGKTWHVWNTGQLGDALPLGDPMLAPESTS